MTMTSTGPDDNRYAILYVDDEEQALKYFRKGFSGEYAILTAPGVPQGLALLEKEHARVGVILSDHRMPGHTGVELLGKVRQAWPDIVRILVTAYSDVGSAIDAVNTGSVYKYLTKPVDPAHLGQVLREAMALFAERRRRDSLLEDKAGAVQQMIVADRVKTIAAMASGISQKLRGSPSVESVDAYLQDWGAGEAPLRIADEVDVEELARQSVAEAAARGCGDVFSIQVAPGSARVKVDREAAVRMLRNLLAHVAGNAGPQGRVTVSAEVTPAGAGTTGAASGVRIRVRGDGPAWSDEDVAAFFTPFASKAGEPRDRGLSLFESYRVAQGHGGELLTHKAPPPGPGFELRLPLTAAASRPPAKVA